MNVNESHVHARRHIPFGSASSSSRSWEVTVYIIRKRSRDSAVRLGTGLAGKRQFALVRSVVSTNLLELRTDR